MLLGRGTECATLDRLLAAVRGGASRTLVLRGEAGAGKTALLEYLVERATECQVARATGVQSEMELAFAGLQQLCAPMLGRLDRLPAPQREALATAFGLRAGAPPDRFLVGLAVLSLLSEATEERPLVCVVDDAQWLDRTSAQTLAFVARRVLAESVALVFAARDSAEELSGLPELAVEGLADADARVLLASAIPGALDERVRERIIAETRGNPLALLELPRGLTPARLAGGFASPGALSGRIEDSFRQRLEALPHAAQRFLLLAAAEPLGDPLLLWRAADRLGLPPEAATAGLAEGLLELEPRVRFRHPLVRSAVYRAGSLTDRVEVHAALAEVTDPDVDPDRRAWHRAQAAAGPDEAVAEELVRSAHRAQGRGGLAAAAAFLERAAALTLDPGKRAGRALAAARAEHEAGAFDAALRLLADAQTGPLDELQRAEAELLRARIAFAQQRGSDAPPLLLKAAGRLAPLDPDLSRATYLEALATAMFAARMDSSSNLPEVAEAARAAPPRSAPAGPVDLLLDGLTTLIAEGHAVAAPAMRRAVRAFRGGQVSREEEIRWLWVACRIAMELWDDEAWEALSTRQVQLARGAGALAVLPIALMSHIALHLETGGLAATVGLLQEQEVVTEVTATRLPSYAVMVAALRGREDEVTALAETAMNDAAARGQAQGPTIVHTAGALLYNALGRYEDAFAAARRATARRVDAPTVALVELVEAAVRSGRREQAVGALNRLSATTTAGGTDWALGVEARCRALLSQGDAAERLHREATDRLGRTRVRVPLARAHLQYGEWLRRERRRLDAREQLRTAHGMYSAMGVEAFADRAARELLAAGETARRRGVTTRDQLTAREAQIARLARDGLSNPEIGARLFISPRTVQYHLRKIFSKLGISSRTQLDRVLSNGAGAAEAV